MSYTLKIRCTNKRLEYPDRGLCKPHADVVVLGVVALNLRIYICRHMTREKKAIQSDQYGTNELDSADL